MPMCQLSFLSYSGTRDCPSNRRQRYTCAFEYCGTLWYPVVRDRSTWGKFGAHGEHGDVFLFSNLGAL